MQIKIRINDTQLKDWTGYRGFVRIKDSTFFNGCELHDMFNEYHEYHLNDPDYTFNNWCEGQKIYNLYDFDLHYGKSGWSWKVIPTENADFQLLIINIDYENEQNIYQALGLRK